MANSFRFQQSIHSASECVQNWTLPVTRRTYKNYIQECIRRSSRRVTNMLKISKKPKDRGQSFPPSMPIIERLAIVAARCRARKAEKEAKRLKDGTRLSKSELEKMWGAWLREFHPKAPRVWQAKEMIILHSCLKAASRRGDVEYLPFLKWCVQHWNAIINQRFQWMRNNKPAYPMPYLIVKFFHIFRNAYEEREEVLATANMSLRDRMVQQRERRGMDKETAQREVDLRLGNTAREKKNLQQLQTKDAIVAQADLEKRRKRALLQSATKRKPERGFKPTEGSFGIWK